MIVVLLLLLLLGHRGHDARMPSTQLPDATTTLHLATLHAGTVHTCCLNWLSADDLHTSKQERDLNSFLVVLLCSSEGSGQADACAVFIPAWPGCPKVSPVPPRPDLRYNKQSRPGSPKSKA
jgi:hypothetical protein